MFNAISIFLHLRVKLNSHSVPIIYCLKFHYLPSLYAVCSKFCGLLLFVLIIGFAGAESKAQNCTPIDFSTSFERVITARKYTLTNIELNNIPATSVNVAPGANVNVKFAYSINKEGDYCPSCGVQFYWGINGHYSKCERHFGGYCNCNGNVNETLTAPTVPGVYYLSIGQGLDFNCNNHNNRPQVNTSSTFASIVVGSPLNTVQATLTSDVKLLFNSSQAVLSLSKTGSECVPLNSIKWFKDSLLLSGFNDQSQITISEPGKYYAIYHRANFDTAFSNEINITSFPTNLNIGNALSFDGSATNFAYIPHTPSQVMDSAMTFECWVKPNASQRGTIVMKGANGWGLSVAGDHGCLSGLKLHWWNNDQCSQTAPTTVDLKVGEWQHIAVVVNKYPSKSLTFYLNGTVAGIYFSQAIEISNGSNSDLIFGKKGSACSCDFFDGEIDEVRWWNTALPDTTIRNWKNRFVQETHPYLNRLVSYYQFNESSGNQIEDVLNVNNGTLHGGTRNPSTVFIGSDAVSAINTSSLTLTNNQNIAFSANNFSSNANLLNLYHSNEIAGNNSVPSGIDSIKTSAGLFGVDKVSTGTITYTAQIDYTNIPGLNGSGNESKLRLLRRADATQNWELASSQLTIDTVNNIIYSYRNTGTEFVIGFANATYPSRPGSGGALELDGNNQYVTIGNKASLNFDHNNSFTIEAWVKTSASSQRSIFSKMLSSGSLRGYDFLIQNGIHLYYVSDTANATTPPANTSNVDFAGYYGVFAPGGNSYNINYDASSIVASNQARVINRDNNSDNTWAVASGFSSSSSTGQINHPSANSQEFTFGQTNSSAYPTPPGSGYALEFDGADDFVSVNRESLATGLTFEAWVNTTSNDASSSYIGNSALCIIGDNNNNIRGSFGIHKGKVRYAHWTGVAITFNFIESVSSVNDGNWHHIAVTHNATTRDVLIYVDGVLETSAQSTTYHTSMAFNRIGGSYLNGSGTGDLFQGKLDEVRVWNTALSEEEIRTWLARKINGSHPALSNLVSYYRFDDASGTTLLDLTENIDGTLINMDPNTDWVTSGAFIGDTSTYTYANADVAMSDVLLTNVLAADGLHLYFVNDTTNSTTTELDYIDSVGYYGVFAPNGTFDLHISYPNFVDASLARIAKRNANNDTNWATNSGNFNNDSQNNQISVSNQSQGEFTSGEGSNTISITSFTPLVADTGATITINGSGFTAGTSNTIFFGKVKTQSITASATQITCKVPRGASFDNIQVLNGYSEVAKSPLKFTPTFNGYDLNNNSYNFAFTLDSGFSSLKSIGATDLDGDGKVDIIIRSGNPDGPQVYLNGNSGNELLRTDFTRSTPFTNAGSGENYFVDLDNDGKPEWIEGIQGSFFSVRKNNSTPGNLSFGAATNFSVKVGGALNITFDDFNLDNKTDAVVFGFGSQAWEIFENTGTPGVINSSTFTARDSVNLPSSPSFSYFPVSGDIDGDGYPDLIVPSDGLGGIFVYRNTSSGSTISFTQSQAITLIGIPQPRLADFDGDGKLDILVFGAQNSANFYVLRNTSTVGNISFAAVQTFPNGSSYHFCNLEDVDGDGKVDFIKTQLGGGFKVHRNISTLGNIDFTSGIQYNYPQVSNVFEAITGDFNQDGAPDVAVYNAAGKIYVYQNNNVIEPIDTTNLTLATGGGNVNFTWNKVNSNGVKGYHIYSVSGSTYTLIDSTNSPNDTTYSLGISSFGNITYGVAAVSYNQTFSDTALDTIALGLAGVYTIGASGGKDFATFAAAVSALNTYGVYSGLGVINNSFDPTTPAILNSAIIYSFTEPTTNCVSTDTQTVVVHQIPNITFPPLNDVCIDEPIFDLNAIYTISPAAGYFKGNGVDSAGMFDASNAGPGTHDITYIYTNANACTDSLTRSITVNGLPSVTFIPLNPRCIDAQAFALSGVFPTGGIFSGTGVSSGNFYPNIAGAGVHPIDYVFTDANGCSESAQQQIEIFQKPTVNLASLSPVCSNQSPFTLTQGTPSGGNYSGNGVIAQTTFNPVIPLPGTYNITYNYTDSNQCSNSDTASITVLDLPQIIFPSQANSCVNSSVFSMQGVQPSGGYFLGTAIDSAGVFNPVQAGEGGFNINYFYTDAAGCTNSEVQNLIVYPLPRLTFTLSDEEICIDESVEIRISGALTYEWANGKTGALITEFPEESQFFKVLGTDVNSCQSTDSVRVRVINNTEIEAVFDELTTSFNTPVKFNPLENDLGNLATFRIIKQAENGRIDSSLAPDLTYNPNQDFRRFDTLIYLTCDQRCPLVCDTALVSIQVYGDPYEFVPNGFTPNGDGINDFFVVPGIEEYPDNEFIVFSRNGEPIFKSSPYTNNWEGQINAGFLTLGNRVPDGTYYFVLKLSPDLPQLKGFIELRSR